MAVWDPKTSWSFLLLLAAAGSQRVNYPAPVCAVRGSSVTLLCTFTPLALVEGGGVQINRVVWCQNHEICQGTTPTVYDSEERNFNNPRYRYLGDKEGNCTLQITDVQKEDEATLRFRMETNDGRRSFTGPAGVRVRVVEGTQMEIRSSAEGVFRRGEAVTLNCTTTCTFHHLELTWFRDGHALKFTGPALHLGSLTAEDSGNYTCGLKNDIVTRSRPHSLLVEEEEEEEEEGIKGCDTLLVVPLVLFSLLTVLVIIVASMVLKRTCVCQKAEN